MNIIEIKNLIHRFAIYNDEGQKVDESTAINEVTVSIEKGSFTAVLGHNGSGKSTLAKHLNGLLLPDEGAVHIASFDTKDESHIWDIRSTAGMVFQNPDNQMISNVVEEDVAFGPENLGIPSDEIWHRVADSLRRVGMYAYRTKSPNHLSGGQKQRIAIAGILSMKPQVIILDEPTAMLDPIGRKEVLSTLHELNKTEGITVILITHYMEEVTEADRVLIMDEGRLVMDGTPRQIFTQIDKVKSYRLDVPEVTELSYLLKKDGFSLPDGILTADEFCDALIKLTAKENLCP